MTPQHPPPGWYQRGSDPAYVWWDGQQWTEHRRIAEVARARVEGATVSTTTETRIKWLGIHWGLGPPVANIVLGSILILPCLGFLGLLVVVPWEPQQGELVQLLLWVGLLSLFILMGLVAIINGYFGLKLARMRREANRYV